MASAVLVALFGAAGLQQSGSFTALTYNTAGLPQIISSALSRDNAPIISPKLNNFDIVNVQEDFEYDKELTADINFPFSTPHTGTVIKGSGLRTFSRFPYKGLQAEKWIACDPHVFDCFTPKGFTVVRISIAPGVEVDVYNLHSDAGDQEGDIKARQESHAQLKEFIGKYSIGRPVVLLGDTNSRYTTKGDAARIFTESPANLKDVWVETQREGKVPSEGDSQECAFPFRGETDTKCELIDKIFYRSSPLVSLKATEYHNHHSDFLDAKGRPLSDHYPISARFAWERSKTLRESIDEVGGTGGTPFSDLESLPQEFNHKLFSPIATLNVYHGNYLQGPSYSHQYIAKLGYFNKEGKNDQTRGKADFEPQHGAWDIAGGFDYSISELEVCAGQGEDGEKFVAFVEVAGSSGFRGTRNSFDAGFRGDNRDCKKWRAPGPKWKLVGFKGRQGDRLISLGPIWGVTSERTEL